MIQEAFELSEQLHLPILMRVTTRMAHSRAVVECNDVPRQQNELNYDAQASSWVLLPAFARKRNDIVTAQQPLLEQMSVDSKYNAYFDADDRELGAHCRSAAGTLHARSAPVRLSAPAAYPQTRKFQADTRRSMRSKSKAAS